MMEEKGEIREILHEAEELEEEVVPPKSALPPLTIPDVRLGRLLLFLGLFFATLLIARATCGTGPSIVALVKSFARKGTAPPSNMAVLLDYFLIMCVSCQFFPIPTLPPIAFTAKAFHPLLVALLGSVGTCIANLNDYAILSWLFRHRKVKKVRDISTYRRLLSFFDRYAFLTMSVASFLPVPIDVIRMLAISRAYPYWRYVLATFAGRFPRYVVIAYLGRELPVKYILVLFAVTAVPALAKFVSDIIRKRKKG
jgi:membrane protein YqaA with SNARE-associated domain